MMQTASASNSRTRRSEEAAKERSAVDSAQVVGTRILTDKLDHVGLAVLASVVNHSVGASFYDRIHELVSESLTNVGRGPE